MEYQDGYDLEKIVNDPETVMEENQKFADQCYEDHDGEIYLKEKFIINLLE